jgi:uncharacterized protein YkwD
MKLWQALALIWLSFLVVVGSGGSFVATAAPQARGVNARLVSGVTLPYGSQSSHLFADWYHFPDLDTTTAKTTLAASADVVEPDYIATTDDTYLENALLNQVSAPSAWSASIGAGVTVAILDTGVDCTHPALRSRCSGDADVNGHGTHVAGLAAGIAPGATIRAYRVMDANGQGQFSTIAQAITQAASAGARVENLSFGCPGCYSQMMQDAVNTARSLGALTVAAAGNDGSTTPSVPAYYASLSVAAVDARDGLASFSNRGSWVSVAAPGVDLLSTCRGGSYCRMTGTSMASPVAAGVTALSAAAHPGEGVDAIAGRVADGDAIGQTFRRVNAAKAAGAPGGGPPQPTSTPLAGRATATPQAGDYGAQVVTLVNDQRRAAGLASLREVAALHDAADWHNLYMSNTNCFAHQCPGEPDPGQRAVNAGYPSRAIGENIAAGYVTPADTVTGWMNSPGHRAAILGNYTDIGCGYIYNAGTTYRTYWTCDFGGVGSVGPTPGPGPTQPITPLPSPTPYGAGRKMIIVAEPGNKSLWDELYARYCSPPRTGARCLWPRIGEGIVP